MFIVHPKDYENSLCNIRADDCLIDSWLLGNESIKTWKIPKLREKMGEEGVNVQIVDKVAQAICELNDINIIRASATGFPDVKGTRNWQSIGDFGQGCESTPGPWESVRSFVTERKGRINVLHLALSAQLTLKRLGGVREKTIVDGAFNLQIAYASGDDDRLSTISLFNPLATLYMRDNDLYVILAYLHHYGLVAEAKTEVEATPDDAIGKLLSIRDSLELRQHVGNRFGRLRLKQEAYSEIECGVLILDDTEALPRTGNTELANANLSQILNMWGVFNRTFPQV